MRNADKEKNVRKKAFRTRIEAEDALLGSRTNIFLGVNGLWVAAILIRQEPKGRLIVACTGTIISFLWFTTSWMCWKVLTALTKEYLQIEPLDEVEKTVQETLGSKWWRPTFILGLLLPFLSLLGWLAGLYVLYRLSRE